MRGFGAPGSAEFGAFVGGEEGEGGVSFAWVVSDFGM